MEWWVVLVGWILAQPLLAAFWRMVRAGDLALEEERVEATDEIWVRRPRRP